MSQILVVDSAAAARQAITAILHGAGDYIVQTVPDGWEGLRAAFATTPDAVVLDMHLSGMDGAAVLHHLRAHGISCPVIAYTTPDERDPEEYEDMGFDAYITKSNDSTCLVEVLRSLLATRKRKA
ncbi:MAG: response regulator [Chloroflexaceae bacterium]|nr:response regulator [Chloroflexaceae bacterium]NJO06540.1 response regulator [Chloroflexaceae bacterium]